MLHTILVPLDGSALSEQALPTAAALAEATDAQLVLVRAVWATVPAGMSPAPAQLAATHQAEAHLSRMAARLRARGISVKTVLPYAQPAQGILLTIQACQADLVVMTAHGRTGPGQWVYGSVAEAVLASSPVPVWLIRGEKLPAKSVPLAHQPANLLIPLDGSACDDAVLPYAATIARALNWTVTLMRVVTPPLLALNDQVIVSPVEVEQKLIHDEEEAHQYLTEVAATLRRSGLAVETTLCIGQIVEAILEESWMSRVALVAMAPYGQSGRARLLDGSVAHAVLNRGACPLLLVHSNQYPAPRVADPIQLQA